jgi:hypothetical protein
MEEHVDQRLVDLFERFVTAQEAVAAGLAARYAAEAEYVAYRRDRDALEDERYEASKAYRVARDAIEEGRYADSLERADRADAASAELTAENKRLFHEHQRLHADEYDGLGARVASISAHMDQIGQHLGLRPLPAQPIRPPRFGEPEGRT